VKFSPLNSTQNPSNVGLQRSIDNTSQHEKAAAEKNEKFNSIQKKIKIETNSLLLLLLLRQNATEIHAHVASNADLNNNNNNNGSREQRDGRTNTGA
jgi:hypothetical protein